jgi:hypothetical protein
MSYALYTYQSGIYACFGSYQTVKRIYICMGNTLFLYAFACFGVYQTTKSQTTIQYIRLTDEEKPGLAGFMYYEITISITSNSITSYGSSMADTLRIQHVFNILHHVLDLADHGKNQL